MMITGDAELIAHIGYPKAFLQPIMSSFSEAGSPPHCKTLSDHPMNTRDNIDLVKQTYACFERGDMESQLALYALDIDWALPSMPHISFGGSCHGRESVRAYFEAINTGQEILQFEAQQFVAQGDTVVVLGHYAWRVKATGLEYHSDWVHVCTVRNGQVIRFREHLDTAAAVRAHTQG